MAADTNKKSNPSDAPQIVSGDSGQLKPPSLNKKKVFIVGLAIIIVALIAAWLVFGVKHVGRKVYAEAAGHKIYKQDVDSLIGNTKGVSDQQAATVLANKYLVETLAKEQGISINNQDIQVAYGSKVNLNQQMSDDKYAYQIQVNNAYFTKLQNQYQGLYKGDLLVAQFSRFITLTPPTPEDKKAYPQRGNPAAIAEDKAYAKNFINKLYKQLQNKQITWDQAVEAEHNDPRLGTRAYPALTHSGPFDTSKGQNPLFNASALKEVGSLKAGQTSKPFVVRVDDPEGDKNFESYFLVVRMDSTSGGGNSMNFQQYLADSKNRLGYEVNV